MFAADLLVFVSILSAACCQSALEVSIPKSLNTTSGSCLLIPCLLNISKERENILESSPEVTWRRGSLWSLYDTDGFTIDQRQKEPVMEVVGDLRKKNCTSVMRNLTSLHSDRYFFRIQAENFQVTETNAVHINVSDSLAEPAVTVPVLREGEEVNLTCTVPAPCPSHPPNVIWDPTLGGNVTQRTQMNADGTQSVSAILNFIPLLHHHELKVNCVSIQNLHRDDRPLLSHKMVILSVEYPPKETWISFTDLVWLGDNVTLTCQSKANPPAVHRWFMKRAGLEEELGISHVISFTASRDNTGEYICEAQNLYGAMNSTNLQITVLGMSFTAFLSILGVFLLFKFALVAILISMTYRRCKEPIRSETSQDQNICISVSAKCSEKRAASVKAMRKRGQLHH
ncbi:myelin-associated glycoprotein-like [Carassius auratus]|uniref:Myelin-associated glycoprotein-like n=1 Tax=Carassius auratus TaxID=7957 RepID=A0A6P6LR57_CARAU|nr:myelin-associated glycoprotein-like [Carassius auratus]